MRLSTGGSSLSLFALLAVSSAHAGFLDRLTGAGQPKAATQINLAADPAPPSEPSLDAFGGSAPSAHGHAHVEPVQPGAPSIALGQPAVKTGEAVPVTANAAQQPEQIPYEGTEYRWKMFRVSCCFILS